MTRSNLQHVGFAADDSSIDGTLYPVVGSACPCGNTPPACSFSGCQNSSGRGADGNGNIGMTNAGWGAPDAAIANLTSVMAGTNRSFQLIYREDPGLVV